MNELKNEIMACSICFDEMTTDTRYVSPCNHEFHHSCMIQWLSTKDTCPLCRKCFNPEPENNFKGIDDFIRAMNEYEAALEDEDSDVSDDEQDFEMDDEGLYSYFIETLSPEIADLRTTIRRERGTEAGKLLETVNKNNMENFEYMLLEDEETRVVMDFRKSVLKDHENMVGNFGMELVEHRDEFQWEQGSDNSEYICAYHERKINNIKQRVYSRVSMFELRDGTKMFYVEITGIDILHKEKQKQKKKKYQMPSKKMPKKMNFKYNRARNNFVGRRHIRA
jgi:hypothetical protein